MTPEQALTFYRAQYEKADGEATRLAIKVAALEAQLADSEARVRALRRLSELNIEGRNDPLTARIAELEAALRKIENNDMRYDLTACAQIAREAMETTVRQAHSKSEYKRLTALGVDVLPPAETVKEYDPGPPDCPHGYWKAHCAICRSTSETKGDAT